MTVARSIQGICSNYIFSEDRQHLGAVYLHQAGRLDVARACDTKTRVALEEAFHSTYRDREGGENDQNARTHEDPADGGRRTPPGFARRIREFPRLATTRRTVANRIVHFQWHAGQSASRKRHTGLSAPESRLWSRVFFPHEGSGFIIALCHA